MTNEYDFLIKFYADLAGFPIIISEFINVSEAEKIELVRHASLLQVSFEKILPGVQNRQELEIKNESTNNGFN